MPTVTTSSTIVAESVSAALTESAIATWAYRKCECRSNLGELIVIVEKHS